MPVDAQMRRPRRLIMTVGSLFRGGTVRRLPAASPRYAHGADRAGLASAWQSPATHPRQRSRAFGSAPASVDRHHRGAHLSTGRGRASRDRFVSGKDSPAASHATTSYGRWRMPRTCARPQFGRLGSRIGDSDGPDRRIRRARIGLLRWLLAKRDQAPGGSDRPGGVSKTAGGCASS